MKQAVRRVSVAVLAAAGLVMSAPSSAADTIKIGLLTIDSGPFAHFMRHVVDPAKLAVEQLNAQGGANGRKYELVVQSHAGTPAAAIAAATRVVQQEGASFVMGWMTSSIALGLSPRMAGLNALLIDPVSNAGDLIGKNCQANYFRVSAYDGMVGNAFRHLLKDTGVKTWSTLAADYATGHAFSRQVNEVVAEMKGTVGKSLFAPLGTTDFGTYISQLNAQHSEGLAVSIFGSDGIALAKQQQQFGLFAKYKSVVSFGFTDEIMLPSQGDSTIGVYATQPWSSRLSGAKVAAFSAAYEQAYRRKPIYVDADVYTAIELLHAAIQKAKSTDVAAVRGALSGMKLNDTVLGDVELRAADHQLVRPVLVVQIAKGADGKPEVAVRSVLSGVTNTPAPNPECKLPG